MATTKYQVQRVDLYNVTHTNNHIENMNQPYDTAIEANDFCRRCNALMARFGHENKWLFKYTPILVYTIEVEG